MIESDDALTARLIRHEGLRLKPYRDTAGRLTIGVGRNLDGAGLSRAEVMLLLTNDIAVARAALDRRWPWWRTLDPVRGDVMTELTFNLGAEGLAAFTTVLDRLRTSAFVAAAADLLTTKWASQVGARAQELAKMIQTGSPICSSTPHQTKETSHMDDTKPAIASTTVWGSLIALLGAFAPILLGLAGISAPADQAATISTVTQLATGVGAAVALYGRLTATKKISGVTTAQAAA